MRVPGTRRDDDRDDRRHAETRAPTAWQAEPCPHFAHN